MKQLTILLGVVLIVTIISIPKMFSEASRAGAGRQSNLIEPTKTKAVKNNRASKLAISTPKPTSLLKMEAAGTGNIVANELGRIMILEYHLIGAPEAQWRRAPENFKKDLELLYANDFYPVSLSDMVNGSLKVPAGKTPFVLTFDDSSQGQFRYLQKDDRIIIDPKCAVGMMEEFKKQHPDFPLTATFFVLPEIKKGLRLFGQEEFIQQKLAFLVQHGYEIGNHSYWHQNLGKTDDLGVRKQLALAVKDIQSYLPGYQIRSLALPLGVHPKNAALEKSGEYEGISYQHQAVLLVGSGTAPSPFSRDFNPFRLERIQAGDTAWGPAAYIKGFLKAPSQKYISDGNPAVISVPRALADQVGEKWQGKCQITTLD